MAKLSDDVGRQYKECTMQRTFFMLLMSACLFSCIEPAKAQTSGTNQPMGGFIPPSDARKKQMAEELKQYRESLLSISSQLQPTSRIVIHKIDCCRTTDVNHAVHNVWNKQYSAIVAETEITNSKDRTRVNDALRAMFANTTQIGSSVRYHFPSHLITYYQDTATVLKVSISWEDNTFHVDVPRGGSVCMFKDTQSLSVINEVVPFSEFDQTMINRRFYAEKCASNSTNVVSRIDMEAIQRIVRDFVSMRNTNSSRAWIKKEDERKYVAIVRIGNARLGEHDIIEAFSSSIGRESIIAWKPGVALGFDKHSRLDLRIDCWGPAIEGELRYQYGYLAGHIYNFRYVYDGTQWLKEFFDLDGVI